MSGGKHHSFRVLKVRYGGVMSARQTSIVSTCNQEDGANNISSKISEKSRYILNPSLSREVSSASKTLHNILLNNSWDQPPCHTSCLKKNNKNSGMTTPGFFQDQQQGMTGMTDPNRPTKSAAFASLPRRWACLLCWSRAHALMQAWFHWGERCYPLGNPLKIGRLTNPTKWEIQNKILVKQDS